MLGATGFEHHEQDNAKLKLAYDFTPALRGTYVVGYFDHDNKADAQTYLRNAAGDPVYVGSVNIDGYAYNVVPSVFSNGVYRAKQEHLMQGLILRSSTGGEWGRRAGRELLRLSDGHAARADRPAADARNGGAGTITSMDGTGWATFDARAFWRPQGIDGAHQVSFGAHWDQFKLVSPRYATTDWIGGDPGTLTADSRGNTRTYALWLHNVWRFDPRWRATLAAATNGGKRTTATTSRSCRPLR